MTTRSQKVDRVRLASERQWSQFSLGKNPSGNKDPFGLPNLSRNFIKPDRKFVRILSKLTEISNLKDLTKGLDSSKEITKLHTEAMQEVRNERNENDKIVTTYNI